MYMWVAPNQCFLGCQWNLAKQIDEGIAQFGSKEIAAMAPAVQGKAITAALDENFHKGPCLVGIEPASNFIFVEEAVCSRDTADWQNTFAPVLVLLCVKITQVTSAEKVSYDASQPCFEKN